MNSFLPNDRELPLFAITVGLGAMILTYEKGEWEGIHFDESEIKPFLHPTIDNSTTSPHEWENLELTGRVRKARDAIQESITRSIDARQLKTLDIRRDLKGNIDCKKTWIDTADLSNWAVDHDLGPGEWFQEYCEHEEKIAGQAIELIDRQREYLRNSSLKEELTSRAKKLSDDEVMDILIENQKLKKQLGAKPREDVAVGPRERATLLNIVGGLVELLLAKSSSGKPHSVFENQASVIEALEARFQNTPGIKA